MGKSSEKGEAGSGPAKPAQEARRGKPLQHAKAPRQDQVDKQADLAGAPPKKPGRARRLEPAARRQDILDAALSVFAEHGFEAARLDDVAVRAGVAKGTLYLHFTDKEELFEEVVRSAVTPIVERLGALAAAPDIPIDKVFETMFAVFEKDILATERRFVIRLVIAEGPRFPRIAEFYYRNVVGRILPLVRGMAERAALRGEISSDAIARYPQLIAAPLLMAIVWDALFARIAPIDFADFFRAHRELLAAGTRRAAP